MQPSSLLLAALLVASADSAAAQTPEDAAQAFYAWVLAHPSAALPSPGERPRLSRVLSPQLMKLIEDASATEARCVKTAPKGDKPLIVEGDLFVGNLEGATEVAHGEARRNGDVVVIDENLTFVDRRFPKAHKHRAVAWKYSLELRLDGARWIVHDVRFRQDRTLAGNLQDYIEAGTRTCIKR